MDAEYRPRSRNATNQRQADVLRLVGDYGRFAASRLSAEDEQRTRTVVQDVSRMSRESCTEPSGMAALLAAMRRPIGSACDRARHRLRGGANPQRGTRVPHDV